MWIIDMNRRDKENRLVSVNDLVKNIVKDKNWRMNKKWINVETLSVIMNERTEQKSTEQKRTSQTN